MEVETYKRLPWEEYQVFATRKMNPDNSFSFVEGHNPYFTREDHNGNDTVIFFDNLQDMQDYDYESPPFVNQVDIDEERRRYRGIKKRKDLIVSKISRNA